MRRSRGQSEVVGVILLTAVVLVLVVVIGGVLLSQWQSDAEGEPRANVVSHVDEASLTLEHHGGEAFDPGTVQVRVENDGSETVVLDRFSEQPAGRFSPGSVWRHDEFGLGPFSGEVRVLVVHEPTNTVLHENVHDVE